MSINHQQNRPQQGGSGESQLLIPKQRCESQGDGHSINSTESEVERRGAFLGMVLIATVLLAVILSLRYLTSITSKVTTENYDGRFTMPILDNRNDNAVNNLGECLHNGGRFCYPDEHRVHTGRNGFPSFWDYAPKGPMNVTYDNRSLLINGARAMFISGSLHPIRATKQTWEHALDGAVSNGLNMITVYVFWAEHQRFQNDNLDWTLPAGRSPECAQTSFANRPSYCGWSLADALAAAANRGFFVHIRIGPYVCAEYNYGGIPEWVPLYQPDMLMRRFNKPWMDAMEAFVSKTVEYLNDNYLFAHQGGPIIMAQIENELGEERDNDNEDGGVPIVDDDMPPLVDSSASSRGLRDNNKYVDPDDEDVRLLNNITVQDYAEWCGGLGQRLAPNVIWTMCNGLAAKTTILTCNGDCSTKWLENHGNNGRIQIDQPAIWTEDEGGFQIWGDDASHPSDYFWGRTARAMAFDTMRWFARGGASLNYYMWWGGYNRGRAAAAGIMNAYATDAVMCPSGQHREPKFSHFQALHLELQNVASILINTPSQLNQARDVEHQTPKGYWKVSGKQRMFVYRDSDNEVMFVENESKESTVVRILSEKYGDTATFEMNPVSAVLIVNGALVYDSFAIKPAALSFTRKISPGPVPLMGWSSCAEATGASRGDPATTVKSRPQEQTILNNDALVSSDYSWYETDFALDGFITDAVLYVEAQKGGGVLVYVDDRFQGEQFAREHREGNITFHVYIGDLKSGHHRLSLLSESFGYSNLIGRWGSSTRSKVKGVTGDVILAAAGQNQSLVDGREWASHPGLNGHENGYCEDAVGEISGLPHPTWTTAMFNTPVYDPTTHALYLNITTGRGHLWLNSHDLGRYWNITRGDTAEYSQQFYFLPYDLLEVDGSVNKLVFFDVLGSDLSSSLLVVSWLEKSRGSYFHDEVDFPLACI